MSWIWAKLIGGIIFVLIPGFTLKENLKNHPFLSVISIVLGLFLLFLSIKPLVETDNDMEKMQNTLIAIKNSLENSKLPEQHEESLPTVDYSKIIGKWLLVEKDELQQYKWDEITWKLIIIGQNNIFSGKAVKVKVDGNKATWGEKKTVSEINGTFTDLIFEGAFQETNHRGGIMHGQIQWEFSKDLEYFSGNFTDSMGKLTTTAQAWKQ